MNKKRIYCLLLITNFKKFNFFSERNLKVVSFLDLTLNVSTGKYKPNHKPDNKPLYINVNSNYPPNIAKNIPESVSRRINKLPSKSVIGWINKNLRHRINRTLISNANVNQ